MSDFNESRYNETNTESEFGNETEQEAEADDELDETYEENRSVKYNISNGEDDT